jgi:hypothetical protein
MGATGDDDPPLFLGAKRFRGVGFSVWAGTNEAEVSGAGGTPDWAAVLTAGNNSGASDPNIDTGRFIGFGVEGSLPGSGQIRSSAAFTINVTGAAALVGSTTSSVLVGANGLSASASGTVVAAGNTGATALTNSTLTLQAAGASSIRLLTNSVERLEIEGTGAWQLGGVVGTAGQYPRSAGPGAPPVWATIAVGEISGIVATTGAVTIPAGGGASLFAGIQDNGAAENDRANLNFVSGTNTAAVVTDDSGNNRLNIAVNVDDFPLSGLADIGANTVVTNPTTGSAAPSTTAMSTHSVLARVAGTVVSHGLVTLAGSGLGYDSVTGSLFVGAGTGIQINADSIQIAPIASESFFGNFSAGSAVPTARAGSSVAGAGLTYTAGGTLAVGAGTGITVNADDVAWSGLAARRNSGSFLTARRRFNFIEGSNISITVNSDATDDENEITISASGGSSLGLRVNDAAQTARGNWNFVNAGNITWANTDDSGNNESELRASIDQAAAFSWTGAHNFGASIHLAGINNNDTLGSDQTDLAIGAVNRVSFVTTGGSPPYFINSMTPHGADQMIAFVNRDGTDRIGVRHDDGVTGTSTSRWVVSGGESAILPPRTMLMGAYVSGSNRWFASGLVHPFFNTPNCVFGAQLQHNGTDWVRQAFTQYGTAAGLPAAGDIRKGGGDLLIASGPATAGMQLLCGLTSEMSLTGGSVRINASNTTLRMDAGTGGASLGASSLTLCTTSPITGQGRLKIVEGAAPATNSAGEGQLWVESLAPNRLIFRNDENVDLPLNVHCVARLTATSTITAATATDILSYTRPANADRVGTTYRIKAICTHNKTAVTTTSPTFTLAVGGTLFTAILITQPTAAAAAFRFNVEALLTVRSLGAAGVATWAASITVNGNSQFSTTSPSGNSTTGNTTLTTTASQTVALRGQVATAVAGNNIVTDNATIERLD